MTLTFESLETARSQVLGLGPMVEVLEPADLLDSVIEQSTRIVAFYARQAAAMRAEPKVND